jgi:hypothetical protein
LNIIFKLEKRPKKKALWLAKSPRSYGHWLRSWLGLRQKHTPQALVVRYAQVMLLELFAALPFRSFICYCLPKGGGIMRNILVDFYRGNLSPTERAYKRGTDYARIMNRIVGIEEQIRAVIPDEYAELLRQFANAQADLSAASCLEDFISGYWMGVQFMLAAFPDDDGCFRPIGE